MQDIFRLEPVSVQYRSVVKLVVKSPSFEARAHVHDETGKVISLESVIEKDRKDPALLMKFMRNL
jgi:hypothetical protein